MYYIEFARQPQPEICTKTASGMKCESIKAESILANVALP